MSRWLLALFSLASVSLRAADVSVSARLSHRVAEVGAAVQLQIEVKNGDRTEPPDVRVEGLEIRYEGSPRSQRVEIINGRVNRESETTHVYQIVPKREGDFTIPGINVEVDGQVYRTQPVALKVQKGAPGTADASAEARAFAEIEVKKKTAYVGEAVPVEVRLYVDVRARLEDVTNMPELVGDGFTTLKFPQPGDVRETRDGQTYRVIVFRTVMTPGKAGKLSIGPCEIPFIAQKPRPRLKRQRSVFDSIFGNDDFFDPFGAFTERQRYTATAPAVEIEVKPLPAEGRPRDFSGAVGKFQFTAESPTRKVKLGEPVTMKMQVAGEGNFDRVTVPVLADADGWQAYEASEHFEPRDELKTSGTKTFEQQVVPETVQTTLPSYVFSYFDPEQGKYVTLTSKGEPLVVEGVPTPAPAPAISPAAAATPAPAKSVEDIAGLRREFGSRQTFAPLHRRTGFWVINGAAALLLAGLIGARCLRVDPAKARAAALRRERDALLQQVRAGREVWTNAVRVLQLETSLATGLEAACVDAEAVRQAKPSDAATLAGIAEIFEMRDALVFAGGTQAEVKTAQHERVMKTLEAFCRR
jgi:hypothetical protein